MTVFRIGTYNLQNLFDRFDDPYEVGDDTYGRFRTRPKSRSKLFDAGRRIRENGVARRRDSDPPYPIDIVALQEIENFGALLDFVQSSVGPDYGAKTGVVSLPSNDPRAIDLGLIVRSDAFRIGRVISHRFNRFRRSDGELYQFGRDCLQIEVLKKGSREVFLTIFNCHFKSKYTGIDPFAKPEEYELAQELNTTKRTAEVAEVKRIVSEAMNTETDRFAIVGDFNDTAESEALAALVGEGNALGLHSAHAMIPQGDLSPTSIERRARDTHHWKRPLASGESVDEWTQIDYLLCSSALWKLRTGLASVINSPKSQGSDHYLSFVEFDDAPGAED